MVLAKGKQGKTSEKGLMALKENVRVLLSLTSFVELTQSTVFSLAQESAKSTKQWYESSDKAKR